MRDGESETIQSIDVLCECFCFWREERILGGRRLFLVSPSLTHTTPSSPTAFNKL